jgi:hypothetical protein
MWLGKQVSSASKEAKHSRSRMGWEAAIRTATEAIARAVQNKEQQCRRRGVRSSIQETTSIQQGFRRQSSIQEEALSNNNRATNKTAERCNV